MRSILRTDIGKVRKANEDAAFIGDGLCLVCDGMGGHRAGDVAANLVVDIISLTLTGHAPSVSILLGAIANANEQVYKKAAADRKLYGMGTTLTAFWADQEQVILAQVGDSRAYLLRNGVLRQCTHDHSLVAELVRMGTITSDEARLHPQRNLITRSIGTTPHVDPDIFEFARKAGDRWLLCSDGLTNQVSDDEIEKFLSEPHLHDAADGLLALALENGGTDNITLLVLEDEGGMSA